MNDTEDDNPHYDDLISELRALKRFIDGNGDEEADAVDDESPREAPIGDNETVVAVSGNDNPIEAPGDADELPTLREAVRRPRRRDELQLDLLSLGASGDSEDEAEPDRETGLASPEPEPAPEPAPEPDDEAADGVTARRGTDPWSHVETAEAATGDAVPASRDVDPQESEQSDDDTVLAFVLDLSDRILDTIEDHLIERSGERLPDDLRDDLRTAIGDILYQWCER